ncbi:MAG TPA: UDP-3-O-(3-hydroxymyristoyl)glucosamine N-acyltransferase, partial [Armatimonadota bacterium]|nr:UDP-3-O-(3-hydroxymyristoyl)glucosamine N-acyltransferase [Armatimonadota bacterium]
MAGIIVQELADAVGGVLFGSGDILITGAASVNDAGPGDIVLAENEKYLAAARSSQATAVVVPEASSCDGKVVIQVENPRQAFSTILGLLASQLGVPSPGIDPSCRIGERVKYGQSISIGYGCYIGDDVTIGDGTIIHPLVYIGDGVRIGDNTVIHPNVTVYPGCEIGARVVIHAGTVIGSDGFGYIPVGSKQCKVPQIGNVTIEDDVEIGSNTSIDRAKTGTTRIGSGTKIDNLVHIAHNVKIGSGCLIVAQVGVAGSSEIGNCVTMAGQSGAKDHVHIDDGVVVAARAGVIGNLTKGVYSGFPARPHKEAMRAQAAYLRLPEMMKE